MASLSEIEDVRSNESNTLQCFAFSLMPHGHKHPLVCEWGTLLRFRTHLCVSRLPILTIWVIPQYVRVRMLLTWKNTLQCHEKLPTLSIMGIPIYVKRMVVMYCETVLRLCGIRPPALRYGASSYISMGMLAFLGSSSIWCLSIFTSALLTRGIPMYFKGGWMLTNRLHPKMLCLLPHALRSMASS